MLFLLFGIYELCSLEEIFCRFLLMTALYELLIRVEFSTMSLDLLISPYFIFYLILHYYLGAIIMTHPKVSTFC